MQGRREKGEIGTQPGPPGVRTSCSCSWMLRGNDQRYRTVTFITITPPGNASHDSCSTLYFPLISAAWPNSGGGYNPKLITRRCVSWSVNYSQIAQVKTTPPPTKRTDFVRFLSGNLTKSVDYEKEINRVSDISMSISKETNQKVRQRQRFLAGEVRFGALTRTGWDLSRKVSGFFQTVKKGGCSPARLNRYVI